MRQKGLNLVLQRTEMYLIYLKLPIYSFVMPYQNSMNLNSHIFRNAESDYFFYVFSECFTKQLFAYWVKSKISYHFNKHLSFEKRNAMRQSDCDHLMQQILFLIS